MMEYLYASLLLHSAKQPITEENIKKVLNSVGIKPEEGKIKALVASLEGVDIDKAIEEAAVAMAAPKVEEKKEEKKEEEKKPEEAAAGLAFIIGS